MGRKDAEEAYHAAKKAAERRYARAINSLPPRCGADAERAATKAADARLHADYRAAEALYRKLAGA